MKTVARLADHRDRLAMDGVILPDDMEYMPEEWLNKHNGVTLAMDAQPTSFTVPNAGIPALFSTYIDPRQIKVVFAPTVAAEFYGEEKIGDFTTDTASFPLTEMSGAVAAYDDYSQNGTSTANANWVSRQSFWFQTFTSWGEREMAKYGEAKINWAALKAESSNNTLARAQNTAAFYGVSGLKCYGGTNDPNLPAAITPTTKAAGGYTWAVATMQEIYNDFLKMYGQLQTQLPALVNMSSPMDCGVPNVLEQYLGRTSDFGYTTAKKLIMDAFPNIKFTVIPQFSATASGNLIQLKLRDVEGMPVTKSAFTEKLRVHPVIVADSSWRQKKSGGTWGTVIRYPVAIVSMLGA